MNSRLCLPTRLKCLIADQVRERKRNENVFAGLAATVQELENCNFLNYIIFLLSAFISFFSLSSSPASAIVLDAGISFFSIFVSLFHDAENEQFRFNVSNSFPRWPLKVRRTMLCVMRSGSIQFLSSTREMASSPQTRSLPRYGFPLTCVCVC